MKTGLSENSILFGTDGIRGNADVFPFTQEALFALGKALATWARKKYQKQKPFFLLGADTRFSSPRVVKGLVKGIVAGGGCVSDGGILPTPAVYQLIFYGDSFDVGVVVSASHNPYQDNGIKIFDSLSCKISSDDEQMIAGYFKQMFSVQEEEATLSAGKLWPDAADVYQKKVLSLFAPGFLENVKVVLDCSHGATFKLAPFIFKALGAEVISISVSPNGTNINEACGALHPELVVRAVLENRADCGFAFDGDGDRAVAVNRKGEVKDGDDILDLLLNLSEMSKVSHVVGTVMTNYGFDAHLNRLGKNLIRTQVGDKYVAAELKKIGMPLGGEAAGHVILKDYLFVSDGIFVALKVLESIIANNNWNMETFPKFPQVLINVPIAHKKSLTSQPFVQIINEYKKMLKNGRIVVRYSGTENILRIMTEAESHSEAQMVANGLAIKLEKALNSY